MSASIIYSYLSSALAHREEEGKINKMWVRENSGGICLATNKKQFVVCSINSKKFTNSIWDIRKCSTQSVLLCRILIKALSMLSCESFKMVMSNTKKISFAYYTTAKRNKVLRNKRKRKHFHDEIFVNERFMKITHDNVQRRRQGCMYNVWWQNLSKAIIYSFLSCAWFTLKRA